MASLSTRLSTQYLQRPYKSRLQLFSSAKKRKTKPAVRRTTVKDRIRSRATRHNIAFIDSKLAAERATSRLEWGRNAVSAVWRDGAEISKRQGHDHEVVMDSNWWFWNVMLALSPAAFIAAYCEFIGKPAMRKALEEGSTASLPPVPETEPLTEIWKWILALLGQPLTESTVSSAVNGAPANRTGVSPICSNSKAKHDDHLQQLQELKHKVESLEHQITNSERTTSVHVEETPLERKIRKREAIHHKDNNGVQDEISVSNPSSWSWNQWLRISVLQNKLMSHDRSPGSEHLEQSKRKNAKETRPQMESSDNEVARPTTTLPIEDERAGRSSSSSSDSLGHPPAVEEKLHIPSSGIQWWKWW